MAPFPSIHQIARIPSEDLSIFLISIYKVAKYLASLMLLPALQVVEVHLRSDERTQTIVSCILTPIFTIIVKAKVENY